jgi:hypothetical protein
MELECSYTEPPTDRMGKFATPPTPDVSPELIAAITERVKKEGKRAIVNF